jgi:hypothetical protein
VRVLEIVRTWKALKYPQKKVRSAEIAHINYDHGHYLMEMVNGYSAYYLYKKSKITSLKINGETVMVDDPLHWYGMMGLAKECKGKVFVAGLGLGIILHHLVKNKDVTQIDVLEINPDVIELVKPLIPEDLRINIIEGDAFKWADTHYDYDTFVFDLWVKTGEIWSENLPSKNDVMLAMVYAKTHNPGAKVYIWGERDPALNPSVKPVTKEYIDLVLAIMSERKAKQAVVG